MIRIHRCKLTINGSDALRDGSTISMNRIKQILANQLAGLEDIPGRVHIKKVTLDLGEFEQMSINPEFIQRFEETCADLGKKLKELHAIERAKSENSNGSNEDQLVKDELIGALYDLDQTKGIQNALYLIESEQSIRSIIGWNAFQKKYAFLFNKRLSSAESRSIQELLKRVERELDVRIDLSSVKEELKKKSGKEAFSSNEIDFILARMDNISIDSNWLNAIEQAFFNEFKRAISRELKTHLKQVYESFEFSLHRQAELKASRIQKPTSIQADLLHFFATNDTNSSFNELIELIESTSNLDENQWFYALLKAYKREYGREMSLSNQKALLHFNAWKSNKTWQEVPRIHRTALLTKMKKYVVHHKQAKSTRDGREFSAHAYQFILDQLEKCPLNAAWFATISRAYQQEFNSTLPRFVAELLHQFSSEISTETPITVINFTHRDTKSSWICAALEYLRKGSNSDELIELLAKFDRIKPAQASQWNTAFEKFVRAQTGESLEMPRFDELRRFEMHYRIAFSRMHFDTNRKQLDRMLQAAIAKGQRIAGKSPEEWEREKSLLLDILGEIQLDAAWLTALQRRFTDFMGVNPSREFQTIIEQFMEKYVWNESKFLPNFTNPSRPEVIAVESLRNRLTSLSDVHGGSELLELLPAVSDSQKIVELDTLFDGFESAYSHKMPDNLKLELQKINRITENWKEAVNTAINGLNMHEKASDFLRVSLNKAHSIYGWRTQIEAQFTEQFSTAIPSEFLNALTKIEQLEARINENEHGKNEPNGPTRFTFQGNKNTRQRYDRVKLIQAEFAKTNARSDRKAYDRNREDELNFILAFIENQGIGEGWRAKLSVLFKAEFSKSILLSIQNVLDEVDSPTSPSTQNEQGRALSAIDNQPIETAQFLQLFSKPDDFGWHERLRNFLESIAEQHAFVSLNELIYLYELNADESIPIAVQMNIRLLLSAFQQKKLNETKLELTRQICEELNREEQQIRENDFIFEMIEKFPFDAQWFTLVRKNYRRAFKQNISKEFQLEITHFIEQTQNELNRLNRLKLDSNDAENSFSLSLKDYVNTHCDLSGAERISQLVNQTPLNVNSSWLNDLMLAYTAEFEEEMPQRTQEIVLQFAAQRATITWDNLPVEKRKSLLNTLRRVLAQTKVNQTEKGNSHANFTAKYAWMLALLESTPLNAAWYSTLSKAYFAQFKQSLPKELDVLLLDFSRGLFSLNGSTKIRENEERSLPVDVSKTKDTSLEQQKEVIVHSDQQTFISELQKHLEIQTDLPNLEQFNQILGSLVLNENTNWSHDLEKVYSSNFGEKMPQRFREIVEKFAAQPPSRAWNTVPTEVRRSFLNRVRSELDQHQANQPKKGKSTEIFNAMYAWMLASLESTPINAAWYSTLSTAFLAQFKQSFPKELDALLLDFSRGLFSPNESTHISENEDSALADETDDSSDLQIKGDSRFSSDLLRNYVLNVLKKFYSSENHVNLENWINGLTVSELENWHNSLSISHAKTLGELTPEVKAALQNFTVALNHVKTDLSEDNELSVLRNRIKTTYSANRNLTEESLSAEASHLLNWINVGDFNRVSLHVLETHFRDTFNTALDDEIQLHLTALCFETERNAQNHVLKRIGSHDGATKSTPNQEVTVSKLQQKWLLAKVEQLVVGYLTFDDFSEQYRAFFGSPIPENFVQISQTVVENATQTLVTNDNITEEIRQFLRKRTADSAVLSLLTFLDEPMNCSPSDWFKVMLQTYSTRFGQTMPLELQHHLLTFAGQRKSVLATTDQGDFLEKHVDRNEQIELKWEVFLTNKLSATTHPNFRQLENQLHFVHSFLKSTRFTRAELHLLQLDFERKFGEKFPEEWTAQLSKIADFEPSIMQHGRMRKSENDPRSLRSELLEYLASVEKTADKLHLETFINARVLDLGTNWFQVLLANYLELNQEKMPNGMQAILLRFMRHRSENRDKSMDEAPVLAESRFSRAISEASKTLTSFFEIIENETPAIARSVGELLEKVWHGNREDWVDEFAQEYKHNNKRKLSRELIEALKSLEDGVVKIESSVVQISEIDAKHVNIKARLLQFLSTQPKLTSAHLLKVVSTQKNLHSESWFERLAEQYITVYGASMSESDQHALLKFAANDEFVVSELERRARLQSNKEIASKLVNDFIANQSEDQQKTERVLYFLEDRNEQDGCLTSNWQVEIQEMYQKEFSEELPEVVLAYIEDCLRNVPFEKVINQLETELTPLFSQRKNDAISPLRKRSEFVRKPLTNKAKLLQLKEKLEAMKKGNKVEDLPLISNAGIILGWVFWKSVFTQFDWLHEGRFKEMDGVHSAVLAANWLHFSVGELESINPLILAICDVSEEQYVQLSNEELEANMNGHKLDVSVNDFYEMILSMWPIFDTNQHQELIELFISREGILSESPIGRRLKMVKEPFDHLLTIHPIPWPISIINFSWTSLIIEVVWD